jgi:hypothetical protein
MTTVAMSAVMSMSVVCLILAALVVVVVGRTLPPRIAPVGAHHRAPVRAVAPVPVYTETTHHDDGTAVTNRWTDDED